MFANFAEAIAEARGKAQADSLRKTREETPAKLIVNGNVKTVSSSYLKKGDIFECEAGDVIPADGEIIEGLASIDESAITGESAPVIREAGGDKSSVTGGTKVLSDHIKVVVTTQPGESFLDKMISLVEGASRQKTPNEIALTILLAVFTLVFLVVCITLKPMADYSMQHRAMFNYQRFSILIGTNRFLTKNSFSMYKCKPLFFSLLLILFVPPFFIQILYIKNQV